MKKIFKYAGKLSIAIILIGLVVIEVQVGINHTSQETISYLEWDFSAFISTC